MKNKVLKMAIILTIIIGLLSVVILNNSYAASVCTIKGFFLPNNPQPGQEITIEVSASQINEPIAGVGFTLDYDTEKIEYVNATASSEWDLSKTESSIMIFTKNNEATNKVGTIATIKLKVKDNASTTNTTIMLKDIEVTTDDADSVTIGNISQEINITSKQGQQENPPSSEIPNNNNNNNNEQPTEKPATSSDTEDNKIVVVNPDKSEDNSSKNADSSTATKKLPKTGITTVSILLMTIIIGVMIYSYIAYKRIKE